MSNKNRLFEIMGKLDENFDNNTSYNGVQTQTQDGEDMAQAQGWAKRYDYYLKKINTPKELEEAFEVWFKATGFNPDTHSITISTMQSIVKDAMLKLGYK